MHDGRIRKRQRLRKCVERRSRLIKVFFFTKKSESNAKQRDESELHFNKTLHQKNTKSLSNANWWLLIEEWYIQRRNSLGLDLRRLTFRVRIYWVHDEQEDVARENATSNGPHRNWTSV